MLDISRLHQPGTKETALVQGAAATPRAAGGPLFVCAEDFDGTGILAGVDPCASSYWWIPELLSAATPEWAALQGSADGQEGGTQLDRAPVAVGEPENPLRGPAHATRRSVSRSIAAA